MKDWNTNRRPMMKTSRRKTVKMGKYKVYQGMLP